MYKRQGLTGSLIIPNSVTSIGYDAFYGCSGLTGSLTIPNAVTSIEDVYKRQEYQIFGSDIDNDGNTEEKTVLYASAGVYDDMAIASSSAIVKDVRADDDRFGSYSKHAVVEPGNGYTYEITVKDVYKRQDITLTFESYKLGQILYPGSAYSGKIIPLSIQMPKAIEQMAEGLLLSLIHI